VKNYSLLEKMEILTLPRLPGRLSSEETACLLRFDTHELPWLAKAGILAPLGSPAPNAPKYYCTAKVLKLIENEALLDKATKCVSAGWRRKKQSAASKSPALKLPTDSNLAAAYNLPTGG